MEEIMASVLSNLKPSLLWKHFDEIRKIPHCSNNEKALGDYVLSVAEENGCKSRRDTAGNIVIQKPGSSGHEKARTIVLQGHMDMVCEKNSDVVHDFSKDPIDVRIDGEWVTAKGTTLGADNGIGLGAALAVLEDNTVVHGPLELLFTVEEEVGLIGATKLPSDFLKGRILLNLDSEEEGTFTISCAGGGDSDIALPIKRKVSSKGTLLKVMLAGLRGGHSGMDIHTGRGNAVQLLGRLLFGLKEDYDLVELEGGSKHNAIPREAFAYVSVPEGNVEKLKKAIHSSFEEVRFEYKTVEKEMKLAIEPAKDKKSNPLDETSKNTFLALLIGLPHGVLSMSQEIPNLVETSNNVAIIRCKEKEATIYTSSRSSILSALEATRTKIEAIATLASARIKHIEGYPPWTPNLESPLLETMKTIYKKLNGEDAKIVAIHAGLECGIIGEKFPGMDMISFGPELKNPHSPDERVHIGSVERFWKFLVTALKTLA